MILFDQAGTKITFTISNDITADVCNFLQNKTNTKLKELEEDKACKLIKLDLRGVANVDSLGLNYILSISKFAEAHNMKMDCVINNKQVDRIFRFTRFDKFMTIRLELD